MADYSSEIVAIKKAIASGITLVRHGDVETRYDSFEKLIARLRWLENQSDSTSVGPKAGFASFDRGDA